MTAIITFSDNSGSTYPFRTALLRDSSGTWKIDDFLTVYTPNQLADRVLVAFCRAVGNQDAQAAYALISPTAQQGFGSAQNFGAQFLSLYTSCSSDPVTVTGSTATASMKFIEKATGKLVLMTARLSKDSNGDWRIGIIQ